MVETGHLPSWPLIEIRSPCNSSSQTFSTVPAFPSVRTTVLPINSDCALPYSFKIVDARSFTGGIVHPCSSEPTAAQPRDLFARLVPVLGRFEFAEPIDLRSQARR